ncbi:D-glycero-beta-D-manno-heptose-7-phosphate kinase, partial [Candidatus Woesearchaeota archaeon]
DCIKEVGSKLQKITKSDVVITQGKEGMSVFEKNNFFHIPTKAKEVFDVSGAGDTVSAFIALGLTCNLPLRDAAELASCAASVVIRKSGTAVCSKRELLEEIKKENHILN